MSAGGSSQARAPGAFARNVVALIAGSIFSAGLCLSGMTQPTKVLGFLDFFGQWDPSLAFVMGGAVLVSTIAFRVALRRNAPLVPGTGFEVPPRRRAIDRDLLVGAALFGVGWGISGYCPGPAVTSLASGRAAPVVFVAAMLGGMLLAGWLRAERATVAGASDPVARSS